MHLPELKVSIKSEPFKCFSKNYVVLVLLCKRFCIMGCFPFGEGSKFLSVKNASQLLSYLPASNIHKYFN
jgi:hypothetical protein